LNDFEKNLGGWRILNRVTRSFRRSALILQASSQNSRANDPTIAYPESADQKTR
jgi:hypothetical protein